MKPLAKYQKTCSNCEHVGHEHKCDHCLQGERWSESAASVEARADKEIEGLDAQVKQLRDALEPIIGWMILVLHNMHDVDEIPLHKSGTYLKDDAHQAVKATAPMESENEKEDEIGERR